MSASVALEVACIAVAGSAASLVLIEGIIRPLSNLTRVRQLEPLVPYWLSAYVIGFAERIVFSLAIAFGITGVMIAMVTWNLIKLQAHWQLFTRRPSEAEEPGDRKRDVTRTYVAILGGLLSMLASVLLGYWARTVLTAA
jgi:hypothetical protein